MAQSTTSSPTGLVAKILCWTAIAIGAAGDPPVYTYRTNVSEVRIRFSATDQNHHHLATLQANDFAIVDKGFMVRNFQSFTRSDQTKLEIAIVVDTRESVTPEVPAGNWRGVGAVVPRLRESRMRTSPFSHFMASNPLCYAREIAAALARSSSFRQGKQAD